MGMNTSESYFLVEDDVAITLVCYENPCKYFDVYYKI